MRLARCMFVVIGLVIPAGSFGQAAGETNPDRSRDEAAIKQLGRLWEDAWNRHDADALASLLAEDVDFITVQGPAGWLKGREELRKDHAEKHKTRFAQSVWKTSEAHVKFLRPDIALARVLWQTSGDKVPHRKHRELRKGIFTWVVEKRDGKWLIVASQNTETMPPLPAQ